MHPFGSHLHLGLKAIGLSVGDLTCIVTQVIGEAVRHVVRVDALLVRVCQDGACHIVSRDEDKTVFEIEDVNGRIANLRHLGVSQVEFILHTHVTGLLHVDGRSDELAHEESQGHHQK